MHFVGPKSIYAKAGLQSGDEVVSIDGKPVKSTGDVGALLNGRVGSGKTYTMEVVRGGKPWTLTFK